MESASSTRFRILPGLPATGPYPEQYSTSGRGTHREGFVVEVFPPRGNAWVGNFQKGLSVHSEVLLHPNGVDVIVIAGGQGYWVDAETREMRLTFGVTISGAITMPGSSRILFQNAFDIMCFGPSGIEWQTDRLSWDGFRALAVDDSTLRGEALNAIDNRWEPFEVDLATGEATGGGYHLGGA